MADMEEKLNQLLSDPASMQKVLNLASGILGAQKGQSPAAPAETDHAPPGAPCSAPWAAPRRQQREKGYRHRRSPCPPRRRALVKQRAGWT